MRCALPLRPAYKMRSLARAQQSLLPPKGGAISVLFQLRRQDDPSASFRSPLGLLDYLRIYLHQLDNTIFREGFALFALVGFGACLVKLGHRPWHDPHFHLIVLAAVFMAARTLAFPGEAYRAPPASYLMLALGL